MTRCPPLALARSTPMTRRSWTGRASRATHASSSRPSSRSASSGRPSQSDGTAQSVPRPMPAGK
eukprot:4831867-Lingulodinium_polyedra.AAC.1